MKPFTSIVVLLGGLLIMTSLGNTQAERDGTLSDKDMRVLDFEDLRYPALAQQARLQGVVVVRVKLDDEGKVVEVAPISGHPALVSDSVANAKKWRFEPNARRAAVIVYNFRMPGGSCKSATPTSFSILQTPNFVSVIGCDLVLN